MILEKHVAGLNEASLRRFLLRARRAAGLQGQVNVLVTGNGVVRQLNRRFRNQDKPTDVLSFPATTSSASAKHGGFVGEIAISADIARQNARQLGHSTAQEIRILVLHGMLHLAGFDHERDNGEMRRKESKLRQTLGLPVGLIERSIADGPGSARRHSSKRKCAVVTRSRERRSKT